jgi:hypothetical protein
MHLEAGRTYRAKTAAGDQILFTVIEAADPWATVDLDSADGSESNIWLNTRLLIWISSEGRRPVAVSEEATAEVIEELERSSEEFD